MASPKKIRRDLDAQSARRIRYLPAPGAGAEPQRLQDPPPAHGTTHAHLDGNDFIDEFNAGDSAFGYPLTNIGYVNVAAYPATPFAVRAVFVGSSGIYPTGSVFDLSAMLFVSDSGASGSQIGQTQVNFSGSLFSGSLADIDMSGSFIRFRVQSPSGSAWNWTVRAMITKQGQVL